MCYSANRSKNVAVGEAANRALIESAVEAAFETAAAVAAPDGNCIALTSTQHWSRLACSTSRVDFFFKLFGFGDAIAKDTTELGPFTEPRKH